MRLSKGNRLRFSAIPLQCSDETFLGQAERRILAREITRALGAHRAHKVVRRDLSRVLEAIPPGVARNAHTVLSRVFKCALRSGRLEADSTHLLARARMLACKRVPSEGENWRGLGGDRGRVGSRQNREIDPADGLQAGRNRGVVSHSN
jgi:hypothetical protein